MCSLALILSAAMEFVLISEFRVMFNGPPTSLLVSVVFGDDAVLGWGLSPLAEADAFPCAIPAFGPGEATDEIEEADEELDAAFPEFWEIEG